MNSSLRVRYAPSPTGHLHIGSLRTSFYNWLFARHFGGAFLVRIEDTDLERSKAEYTTSILESLKWAGMEPDEPIVIQSSRIAQHKEVAEKLLEQGKLYRCYCTAEELKERLGETAAQEGSYTRYDGKCREIKEQDASKPYALRFKLPDDRETITFNDLIRGPITFDRDQLDDFIIVRSDGSPMYNFVVVVDDAFMRISHVLRGEDHISNTPKQILLYEACGYAIPEFAHFSLILGPDGHRLSKRHGATAVLDFKDRGFLAWALCTYLVRLGWSHGDQELFAKDELIEYFTLEHMHKKQAIFDNKKLEWVNGMVIRGLPAQEIRTLIERDVDSQFSSSFANWSSPVLLSMIDLYKERVRTLRELIDQLKTVHERPHTFTADPNEDPAQVITYLSTINEALMKQDDFSREALDALIKSMCQTFAVPMPQIAHPLRRALTGATSSPGVASLISLMGCDEVVHRISYYCDYVKKGDEAAH